MDSDGNGVDNTVQPTTCNNSLSSSQITDTNTHEIQNFNSVYTQQSNVFVKLKIFSDCSNSNAIAYLNLDFREQYNSCYQLHTFWFNRFVSSFE